MTTFVSVSEDMLDDSPNLLFWGKNIAQIEKSIQDLWQKENLYSFSLDTQKKRFLIEPPPPTLVKKLYVGHLYNHCPIDIIARYKRMRGYNVFYPVGFDTTGLPTKDAFGQWLNLQKKENKREDNSFVAFLNERSQMYLNVFSCLGLSLNSEYRYETSSREMENFTRNIFEKLFRENSIYFQEGQWFLRVADISEKISDFFQDVKFVPFFKGKQFHNHMRSMKHDWIFSKERDYGIKIPIKYCKNCQKPHLLSQTTCCDRSDFRTEEMVFSVWFMAALIPWFLTYSVRGEKKFQPYDVRANGAHNICSWDFYTAILGYIAFKEVPWKSVVVSGIVKLTDDEWNDSREESPMNPPYLIKKYGADAIRFWCSYASTGKDVVFSERKIKEGHRLLYKLLNVGVLMEKIKHVQRNTNPSFIRNTFDCWIIDEYNKMLRSFTQCLDEYNFSIALKKINHFFKIFTRIYLKIVKKRLYETHQLNNICFDIFINILKCYAPFFPHITDYIYQNVFKQHYSQKSIHLFEMTYLDNIIEENNNLYFVRDFLLSLENMNRTHSKILELDNKYYDIATSLLEDIKRVSIIEQLLFT